MSEKQIQTSLTERTPEWKLKLAYFYADHKVLVKKGSIFMLFFVDLIIVFLLGSMFVDYQTGTLKDDEQLRLLPVGLVNTAALKNQQPEELLVSEIQAMKTSGGKYNLMASIKNNNSEWAVVKLDYTFSVSGQNLETKSTFVLPKSEKILMYFNADSGTSAELKILNTNWNRLRDFGLLSYKDGVEVVEATYKPSRSRQLSGEVELKLFNNTPYGFWEVGLPIVLNNQSLQPIAIDYIVINKLAPREERELSVSWNEDIAELVREVRVFPEINLLDRGTIMPLEAPIGSPPGLD